MAFSDLCILNRSSGCCMKQGCQEREKVRKLDRQQDTMTPKGDIFTLGCNAMAKERQ